MMWNTEKITRDTVAQRGYKGYIWQKEEEEAF